MALYTQTRTNSFHSFTSVPRSAFFYFEFQIMNRAPADIGVGTIGIGLGPVAVTTGTANSAALLGVTYLADSGNVFVSGGTAASLSAWGTAGAGVIGVAVDLLNTAIYYRINNGNWNGTPSANPVTNIGGISISGLANPLYIWATVAAITGNTVVTGNFGTKIPYANTPPSGFGNW